MDETITYAPAFSDRQLLEKYIRQAAWHLCPLDGFAQVIIYANCDTTRLILPGFITLKSGEIDLSNSDHIFFWKKEYYWDLSAKFRRNGWVVDEYAEQAVGDKIDAFVESYVSTPYSQHQAAYAALTAKLGQYAQTVNIIGSGPRPIDAPLSNTSGNDMHSVNIFLGTAIFTPDLIKMLPPHIIIASDGPSQFGYSATAKRFRKRVTQILSAGKTYLIVPLTHYANIAANWDKAILRFIIAVPKLPDVSPGNRLSEHFAYQPTSNVLTALGLPVAGDIALHIHFIGITMPNSKIMDSAQRKHWIHTNEGAYQRHVADIIYQHPASIIDHPGYLARHSNRLQSDFTALFERKVKLTNHSGVYHPDGDTAAQRPNESSAFKIKFFESITYLENRPVVFGITTLPIQFTIFFMSYMMLGNRMFNIFIACIMATAIILLTIFFRLRMNRMFSNLETRLSQQQAHQYNNLSARLADIERALKIDKSSD